MIQLETFEKAVPIERLRPNPPVRRTLRNPWFDLFFGPAPLWVRFLVWAQRNNER